MPTSWTNVPKPSGTSYTAVPKPDGFNHTIGTEAGTPIGLLLALTYTDTVDIATSIWTDVTKPSGTSWTKVAKAT